MMVVFVAALAAEGVILVMELTHPKQDTKKQDKKVISEQNENV